MFREMRRKKQAIDETACLEITPEHITGKKSHGAVRATEKSPGEALAPPAQGSLSQSG